MKKITHLLTILALVVPFSVSAKCIDSMESYIKFAIGSGCKIVNAAAENKYSKEMGTLHMSGLKEHCSVFNNGVTKKELDEKYPILTGQSPVTCTIQAQHAAISKIRKDYGIK